MKYKMDAWYEEDEQVFVHPKDLYHRVDVLPSSRRVQVTVNGEVVAKTERPKILFETGLPPRYYILEEDACGDVLAASEKTTRCPYKGVAAYHSVEAGDGRVEDLVWYYPEPLPEVGRSRGTCASSMRRWTSRWTARSRAGRGRSGRRTAPGPVASPRAYCVRIP
jgi:uncharacterized protein (DUF427 family)